MIVSLSPGFFATQFSRLKPLIETLQEEVSKAELDREGRMSSEEEKTGLASKAMADWVQMTWEHNESELDQVCVYRELAL